MSRAELSTLPQQPGQEGEYGGEGEGEERPSQPQPAGKQPFIQNTARRQPAHKGQEEKGKVVGEIRKSGRRRRSWQMSFSVHTAPIVPLPESPW